MMKVEITPSHRWLEKLLGDWTGQSDTPGPDGKPMPAWTERVRTLHGVWVIAETEAVMPDGQKAATMMTLGYDSSRQRYVGSWVGSMMDHMWVYDGGLDETQKILTLDTEGPNCAAPGARALYQDIITFLDDDTRTLTSRQLQPDGSWQQIMIVEYRRRK